MVLTLPPHWPNPTTGNFSESVSWHPPSRIWGAMLLKHDVPMNAMLSVSTFPAISISPYTGVHPLSPPIGPNSPPASKVSKNITGPLPALPLAVPLAVKQRQSPERQWSAFPAPPAQGPSLVGVDGYKSDRVRSHLEECGLFFFSGVASVWFP